MRIDEIAAAGEGSIEQRDELIRQRDELLQERDALIRQRDALMHERDALIRRITHTPARRDLPSALIVSLPKSGTMYINSALEGLGLENAMISNGYFPRDQLSLTALQSFSLGGQVASVHIDPSPENLQLLGRFVSRWVVHVRDPRSATLSWLHHCDRAHANGHEELILRCTPAPPAEYFGMDFAAKVAWQIEKYLPLAVQWICDWLEHENGNLMITEFAGLRHKELDYLSQLLDFLRIPYDLATLSVPVRESGVHYRSGQSEEWAAAFTREQIARANAQIAAKLLKRFGWRS